MPPLLCLSRRTLLLKLLYFAFCAVVLSAVYALPESVLSVRTRETNTSAIDPAVEFWLWAAVLFAWASHTALQGSDPGYIALPPAAAAAAAAAALEESAGSAAKAEAAEFARGEEAAAQSVGGLLSHIVTVRSRASPSETARGVPPPSAPTPPRPLSADERNEALEDAYAGESG